MDSLTLARDGKRRDAVLSLAGHAARPGRLVVEGGLL
jgi:hypothetical protein